MWGRTHSSVQVLFLLRMRLLRSLFWCSLFLRVLLGLRMRCRRGMLVRLVLFRFLRPHLLRLRFLFGPCGSLETLPVKGDLRDAHRGIGLPVSPEFLVLLFAFVVEDQNLRAAAFFHDLADHARIRLQADFAFFAGNRHHGELHQSIGAGARFLHSNYIAGRHPVLLSTGADNRVHTYASVKCREIQPVNGTRETEPSNGTSNETQGAHGRNGLAEFLCLLCFPPRRLSSPGRRPQNGSASTGKLNHFSVCCGNRSNGIETERDSAAFCACPLYGFAALMRESRRIPWREPNAQALSYRFAMSRRPDAVRLCANEEIGNEEICWRPRSRQGSPAENLGRVGDTGSRQCG